MPFTRPTLTALQALVASDIAIEVGGADALLRFSSLGATGRAQAGLANLHYGYLDWISRQAVPFTCTDEFLEGWAGLKSVLRQAAKPATGTVRFAGAAGTKIPAGAGVVRSDGVAFVTTAAGTVGQDGVAIVPAAAQADPAGLTGAIGNTTKGAAMTLAQSIPGVQSNGVAETAFKGGADIEGDDSLRSRMLAAYQKGALNGSSSDYEDWAKQVPGVTRAWCVRNGFGIGTVAVFFMMDDDRAAYRGFPQGQNGVATDETRGTRAAGDQLAVADYLLSVQAAVGLVYAVAPLPKAVNLQIAGIPAALQSAATKALGEVFSAQGAPGGTIQFGAIWSALSGAAPGYYVTVTPATDVVCPAGYLPVAGVITYQGG